MNITTQLTETSIQPIVSLLEIFKNTWNNKNLEQFGDLFTEDAEFTDVVSQLALGKKAIIKQHEFPFNVVMKNATFEFENAYIGKIISDTIFVSANWLNKNSQTPDGKILPDRKGILQLAIIKVEDEKWKIKIAHNSDFALPYGQQKRTIK